LVLAQERFARCERKHKPRAALFYASGEDFSGFTCSSERRRGMPSRGGIER